MTESTQVPKGKGGGGILRNSSDRDDRRISFFGVEIFDFGIFLVGKCWQLFVLVA